MKNGIEVHGVNVGSESHPVSSLSSGESSPLRDLARQETMQRNAMSKGPRASVAGLGKSIAKQAAYAEKAKMKK